MAQYMLLIYNAEADAPDPTTPEGQAARAAWMAVTEEMRTQGALVAGDALQPLSTATTVRVRDDQQLVTDGPFAETREMLAGYYLIEAADLDAATAWAAKLPNVTYGSVEIRPVVGFMNQ